MNKSIAGVFSVLNKIFKQLNIDTGEKENETTDLSDNLICMKLIVML